MTKENTKKEATVKTTTTKNTKKVEDKKMKETKKEETKKATTKKVENKEKKNTTVSIQEVEKLYNEFGIKVANPSAKGNYRIMGCKKGSSLNLRSTKYIIFSTEDDFKEVEAVKGKYADLTLIKGGNSQDKSRPNTVEVSALDTLKAILKLYAKNPMYKMVAAK